MRILLCIFILALFTTCKKQQLDLEVSFSADNLSSADESYKNKIKVTIELNQVADRDVYVKYSKNTTNTTAGEGSDFVLLPTDNYFVIPKGEKSKSFSFLILQDNNYQETDEKIQFDITKAYSANIKKGGGSYIFTIKALSAVPVTGYAYLKLNSNFYTAPANNLSTLYLNSDPYGYVYGMAMSFGSAPSFSGYSLFIRSKAILPIGKIIPLTDLSNPPDTGAYISLSTPSGNYNSISGTLKVVSHDVVNKTLSLQLNGAFSGSNNLSGTIDYYYYDFSY